MTLYQLLKPLSLFLVLTLSACHNFTTGIDGKGNVQQKEITLTQPFNKLSTHAGWEVELIPSSESKMVVHAQKNILPLLDYSVKNNLLDISTKENLGHTEALKIELYFQNLDSISTASGSEVFSKSTFEQESLSLAASSGSDIILDLKTGLARAKTSSGADIELTGTSLSFEGRSSSGSDINARHLKVKNAQAKTSSGADIHLYVLESLDASTSSGGNITYKGNPKKTSLHESTSGGSIDRED